MRSVIVLLLVSAALIGGCDKHSAAPEQANVAAATNASPDEAAPDEAVASTAPAATPGGKVDRSHAGAAAPTVAFTDPAGKPATVATFAGKPLLLNLWATWCGPCVAEMPTLDAVAARDKGRLQVVAVSQDMQPAKVAPFFQAHGFRNLQPYLDAKMGLSLAYQANLPTTILFDAKGREVWRVTGGMDWSGAEAGKLLAEAH